jgi:hypothetical protein
MWKMSTGFAALLVAGLSGGACGGHSGLKSGQDGASAAGGATGGQAGSSDSSAIVGGSSGTMAGGTGGVVGGTGGTVACPPHPCFVLASCADRLVPNPDPCGCPICPPTPDAGVANDAGGADAQAGQFPACPMLESILESLNPTDAAPGSWAPGRFSLECTLANGSTENCLSNDATTCGGSAQAWGSVLGCINQCASDEYGWSVGGIGPGVAAPPPPAGCRTVLPGPGPGFTCCPCGEAAGRDAASSSEVGPSADTGADTSLCPPVVVEGSACPSPNLRCPGFGNPPPLCGNYGTCVCGVDGIWVFEPSMCD